MNFSEAELKALAEVARVLDGVDFVLIGAAALREFGHCHWRSTLDLDFTVALDGDAFPGPLEGGMLRRDARLEHRWYSGGVSLDILPAGPRLIEQGFIRWGDKTMNLTGMQLALAHAVPRQLAPGLVIRVAPPAVITVLKMVAYCDRPAERERDLGDLAHLLEDYVGDNDDRRFEDSVVAANLDWDHVSAHELGMDVAGIITAAELPSIESFLELACGGDAQGTLARLLRVSSFARDEREQRVMGQLDAFRRGLFSRR